MGKHHTGLDSSELNRNSVTRTSLLPGKQELNLSETAKTATITVSLEHRRYNLEAEALALDVATLLQSEPDALCHD